MELLESVGPRPRQARYQAALRPDMTYEVIIRQYLPGLVAEGNMRCRGALKFERQISQQKT
jgi:hypothetical protein